jgi:uncharacterized protein (TIGR04222 family)
MPNLFDVDGPTFLQIYLALMAVFIAVALLVRTLLRSAVAGIRTEARHLKPAEVAYLRSGSEGALQATIAGLAHRDRISQEDAKQLRAQPGKALGSTGPFELAVIRTLTKTSHDFETIKNRTGAATNAIDDRLVSLGLLETRSTRARIGGISATIVAVPVVLGVLRIARGLSLDHKVGYLLLLTFATAVVAMALWQGPPMRSRDGDEVLEKLTSQNEALRETAKSRPSAVAPAELALAVALFGDSVLAGTPHASLATLWATNSGSSGSCGGGGGCGGGCGG